MYPSTSVYNNTNVRQYVQIEPVESNESSRNFRHGMSENLSNKSQVTDCVAAMIDVNLIQQVDSSMIRYRNKQAHKYNSSTNMKMS